MVFRIFVMQESLVFLNDKLCGWNVGLTLILIAIELNAELTLQQETPVFKKI